MKSIVEISESDVPTRLPDVGTWKTGQMDVSTRCFDLLCFGKCDLSSTDIKLNVSSSDKIPNFFMKNAEGKIVVASPQPMMTITTSKDHNTWIQIELKTVNGKNISDLSDFEKHVCLGIKKRSENNYFCVLSADNLSEYVDLFDWDAVELIPLLNSADGIIATGKEIDPTNFGFTEADSFDFGSVYRISIKNEGAWLGRNVNLSAIQNGGYFWSNLGHAGVGIVVDSHGKVLPEQLVMMSDGGQLAYSSDGIHWNKYSHITDGNGFAGDIWAIGAVCGNGIWCVISREQSSHNVVRSIDGGKTWLDTGIAINDHNLAFGDGMFMTINNSGVVYASSNAQIWNAIGKIPHNEVRCLIYADSQWVCCSTDGHIYRSKSGEGEWTLLSDEIVDTELAAKSVRYWEGGIYADGCFYMIHGQNGLIMRSSNGIKWEKVVELNKTYRNLTYYRNRMYTFSEDGTCCYIYLPNS